MAGEFGSPPKRDGRSWESVMGAGRVGKVWEASWRARRGQKALPESQGGLGGLGEVGRPSRRARRGRETLQKGTGGVGRPSWRAGRGWEALLKRVGKSWQALPEGREGKKAQQEGG